MTTVLAIPTSIFELAELETRTWAPKLEALEASGVPVNAVTLAQAAVLSQNDLQAGVLERFLIESPVFDRLPLKQIDGNAYAYNAESTLPGIEFRAVNAAYSESTGSVVQATETLVILGGDADVDTFIQATRSNLNDQLETQIRLKVKAASYKFQDAFFNGDVAVDANSFDGLKKRTTGAQVIPIATNGAPVVGNGGTDVQAFLDFLDALLTAAMVIGENGAIYANDLIKARIVSAGRRANIVGQEILTFSNEITKRIDTYRGTPILDPGLKLDGTRILPQTETQGTAVGTTSSIYAVRFGEDEADQAVTGLFNGNHEQADQRDGIFAVKRLGEQQAKPAHRIRIEGFVGLGVFGGRAVARGTGVLAA
jgi:hypothetical protein